MNRVLVNLVAVLVLLVAISLVTVVPPTVGGLVLPPLKSTGPFDQVPRPYATSEKWFIGIAVEVVAVVALVALKILWPPLTTLVENWLWDLHWQRLKLGRWCRREGRPIYRVWRRK